MTTQKPPSATWPVRSTNASLRGGVEVALGDARVATLLFAKGSGRARLDSAADAVVAHAALASQEERRPQQEQRARQPTGGARAAAFCASADAVAIGFLSERAGAGGDVAEARGSCVVGLARRQAAGAGWEAAMRALSEARTRCAASGASEAVERDGASAVTARVSEEVLDVSVSADGERLFALVRQGAGAAMGSYALLAATVLRDAEGRLSALRVGAERTELCGGKVFEGVCAIAACEALANTPSASTPAAATTAVGYVLSSADGAVRAGVASLVDAGEAEGAAGPALSVQRSVAAWETGASGVHLGWPAGAAAWSPSLHILALGGARGGLATVDGRSATADSSAHPERERGRARSHGQMPLGGSVEALCWHPDGGVLLALAATGEVCVLDACLVPLLALNQSRVPAASVLVDAGGLEGDARPRAGDGGGGDGDGDRPARGLACWEGTDTAELALVSPSAGPPALVHFVGPTTPEALAEHYASAGAISEAVDVCVAIASANRRAFALASLSSLLLRDLEEDGYHIAVGGDVGTADGDGDEDALVGVVDLVRVANALAGALEDAGGDALSFGAHVLRQLIDALLSLDPPLLQPALELAASNCSVAALSEVYVAAVELGFDDLAATARAEVERLEARKGGARRGLFDVPTLRRVRNDAPGGASEADAVARDMVVDADRSELEADAAAATAAAAAATPDEDHAPVARTRQERLQRLQRLQREAPSPVAVAVDLRASTLASLATLAGASTEPATPAPAVAASPSSALQVADARAVNMSPSMSVAGARMLGIKRLPRSATSGRAERQRNARERTAAAPDGEAGSVGGSPGEHGSDGASNSPANTASPDAGPSAPSELAAVRADAAGARADAAGAASVSDGFESALHSPADSGASARSGASGASGASEASVDTGAVVDAIADAIVEEASQMPPPLPGLHSRDEPSDAALHTPASVAPASAPALADQADATVRKLTFVRTAGVVSTPNVQMRVASSGAATAAEAARGVPGLGAQPLAQFSPVITAAPSDSAETAGSGDEPVQGSVEEVSNEARDESGGTAELDLPAAGRVTSDSGAGGGAASVLDAELSSLRASAAAMAAAAREVGVELAAIRGFAAAAAEAAKEAAMQAPPQMHQDEPRAPPASAFVKGQPPVDLAERSERDPPSTTPTQVIDGSAQCDILLPGRHVRWRGRPQHDFGHDEEHGLMLLTRVREPLAIGDTNAASAASLHAGAAASPGRQDASLPRLMRRERADGPPSTPASRRRSRAPDQSAEHPLALPAGPALVRRGKLEDAPRRPACRLLRI